jgi:glutamate racemase
VIVIIPLSTTVSASKSNIYTKISSSTFTNTIPDSSTLKCLHYPITFQNIDQSLSITLIASTESIRKLWLDKIKKYQTKYCQQDNMIESDK